jgi:Pyruvate/2-oxoacid:ferredoxin oxidoreductase delta subunit
MMYEYKAKVAVCSEIRSKHSPQIKHHAEFFYVKPDGTVRKETARLQKVKSNCCVGCAWVLFCYLVLYPAISRALYHSNHKNANVRTVWSASYRVFGKSLCTFKRCWKWCPQTTVSKIWIKQLHTLPVLHFNRCLTTKCSETTAHFNGNLGTDKQIYVPFPKYPVCVFKMDSSLCWTTISNSYLFQPDVMQKQIVEKV